MDEEPLPKRRYVLPFFLHTLGSDLTFSLEENSGHCEKGDQDDVEVGNPDSFFIPFLHFHVKS